MVQYYAEIKEQIKDKTEGYLEKYKDTINTRYYNTLDDLKTDIIQYYINYSHKIKNKKIRTIIKKITFYKITDDTKEVITVMKYNYEDEDVEYTVY